MNNLLYYPYINLPPTDWILRILLYYDNIGSIVPQEYFYEPERNYEEFMLELVRNGLVTPINPIVVLERPWEIVQPFLELVERNQSRLRIPQSKYGLGQRRNIHFDYFPKAKIHADKFDENIFYALQQLGLAERTEERWYLVEQRTANNLMCFLASVISDRTNRLPTTDAIRPNYYKQHFTQERKKRVTILKELIPFPDKIDLNRLLQFKEKHTELLSTFRTKVEQIVLNPGILEGSALFHRHLYELIERRDELSAKMNESRFKDV